jgi:hypothetical protein
MIAVVKEDLFFYQFEYAQTFCWDHRRIMMHFGVLWSVNLIFLK